MNIAQKIKRSQVLLVSFLLISTNIIAQQATEIDTKSVTLPRYMNLAAITAAIPVPQYGMMVYNRETATNWYYNGYDWRNTAVAVNAPLSLNLSAVTGTTIRGVHINSGAIGAVGGTGVYGQSIGGENGAGVVGIGNDGNYGIYGSSGNAIGVFGIGATGGKFIGTNALETDGIVKFAGGGVGIIAAGKVLTSDAFGNATWQAIPAVTGPLGLTSATTTFSSNATGTGGNAGSFTIDNAANNSIALVSTTYGLGTAGFFRQLNTSNINTAVVVNAYGGKAIEATNSSSSNATIKATNSTDLGIAIELVGGIKVSGGFKPKAAFKVVTSSTYIAGNKFGILSTTMANAATDILIVTYEYTGPPYLNKQFATYWNGGNWEIHLTDSSAMPVGITFNILVIKQ